MALTSKKAAATAKERATTLHDDADKATTAVEQTVVTAVGEVAKLTRQAQQAAYEDAQAFFSGVDQLASAKCLGERFRSTSITCGTAATSQWRAPAPQGTYSANSSPAAPIPNRRRSPTMSRSNASGK